MAKAIDFYKRKNFYPKRDWVPTGQNATVIILPDTRSKKSA